MTPHMCFFIHAFSLLLILRESRSHAYIQAVFARGTRLRSTFMRQMHSYLGRIENQIVLGRVRYRNRIAYSKNVEIVLLPSIKSNNYSNVFLSDLATPAKGSQ